MADTFARIGAHAAASSPDPVKLHMQAVNSLECAKACLLANEPLHLFAQQHLEAAQRAVAALQAIDAGQVH